MNSSRTILVAKIQELAAEAESTNEMAAASILCALAGSLCSNQQLLAGLNHSFQIGQWPATSFIAHTASDG